MDSNITTQQQTMSSQLNNIVNFDFSKVIFEDPIEKSSKNGEVTFQEVKISCLNDDGSKGPLLFPTELLSSYGVQDDVYGGRKTGYSLRLSLFSRGGGSQEEKEWYEAFEKSFMKSFKEKIISNKQLYKQWDLELSDLKKLSPIYWKKDEKTGKLSEYGPSIFPKVLAYPRKDGSGYDFGTEFFDNDTDMPIDPLLVKGKCLIRAVLKIDSIFIGSKISLRLKIIEGGVTMLADGNKPGRLLASKRTSPTVKAVVEDEEEYYIDN